ncbi:type II/IV secretion system protein [Candidatus Peregrinibacteria bacterium]|nr:type II/IV secretion system protein [Candidatus Peregrinibacteria bacterium]
MADPQPPSGAQASITHQVMSSSDSKATVISGAISDINQEFKEKEVQMKARELGISYIDVSLVPINPDLLDIIPEGESQKAKIIPFFRVGQKLRVALVDPENFETKRVLNELKEKNYVVNMNLCSGEGLKKVQDVYATKREKKKEVIADVRQENVGNIEAVIASLGDLPKVLAKLKSDEALNVLHRAVLRMGVSDLHLEPQANTYEIRARVDGILTLLFSIPSGSSVIDALIKQIKYNSRLKLNISNVPQDGQYFFKTNDRYVDVRVSTLPTKRGESVVLRFLDPKKGLVELSELGFSDFLKTKLEKVLEARNGLILVTGPTGSGKTTTLYSLLQKVNSSEKKIITLEDPVEYHLPGILQSQVDEEQNYTFNSGLRSILRQDPDIVMVGEIRDLETAETSVQASLTGHIVFSTLHTNSAIDAIPRFLNMGVKNYILAPALRAVIAQRLLRKVCPNCGKEREMSTSEKEEIFETLKKMKKPEEKLPPVTSKMREGKGCEECSKTGFRGQMAVAEILIISKEMQDAIYENSSTKEIEKIAIQNGFRTMWEEGILAVLEGKTTLAELKRAVGK